MDQNLKWGKWDSNRRYGLEDEERRYLRDPSLEGEKVVEHGGFRDEEEEDDDDDDEGRWMRVHRRMMKLREGSLCVCCCEEQKG